MHVKMLSYHLNGPNPSKQFLGGLCLNFRNSSLPWGHRLLCSKYSPPTPLVSRSLKQFCSDLAAMTCSALTIIHSIACLIGDWVTDRLISRVHGFGRQTCELPWRGNWNGIMEYSTALLGNPPSKGSPTGLRGPAKKDGCNYNLVFTPLPPQKKTKIKKNLMWQRMCNDTNWLMRKLLLMTLF